MKKILFETALRQRGYRSCKRYADALYFYRQGNDKMDFSPDYSDYEPRCVDKLKRVFCATSDPAFAVKLMKE